MSKNKNIFLFGLVISAVILGTTAIGVTSLLAVKPIQKGSSPLVFNSKDDGTTVHLKKGDTFSLELKDYGDGGYSWNIVSIDETQLSLVEKTHSQPSGLMGDFGNDIWVFSAESVGSSTLELQCSRSWDTTDVCASFTLQIEVQ